MKTPQLPFPKLSHALGIPSEVWLKREDLHKYGSHKGRSIPLMIDEYRKQGITNFIISSSGNAALAAARFIETKNKSKPQEPLRLQVLVGDKIDQSKLKILNSTIHDTHITTAMRRGPAETVTIQQVPNPKQTAFQLEKEGQGKWLRQSTDDLALVGYHELAQELSKIPNLSAVFIPTSSGTTAQGLYEGFQELGLNPEIHIIQTTFCHPIVASVETPGAGVSGVVVPNERKTPQRGVSTEVSIASAIVDRVAFRKEKVLDAIKNSHGNGWIATNEEITQAIQLVKTTTDVALSPNSALSVVGLQQAIKAGWSAGWRREGVVVCLVTGK